MNSPSDFASRRSLLFIATGCFPKGFWLKTDQFDEQPSVHFKHQFLFLADISGTQGPIFCGTFPSVAGQFNSRKNRCPLVKSKEIDFDHDGKIDEIHFDLEILLDNDEDIFGTTLLLLLDYKLNALCHVNMEGVGLVQFNHPVAGGALSVVGDLELLQKTAFGKRFAPGEKLQDVISADKEVTFDIANFLENYAKRNASIQLRNTYYSWIGGRASDQPFKLNVKLLVPQQNVKYIPGFWQVMKWAWLQYLSMLLVVKWVAYNLRYYIFTNQLVPVIKMPLPWTKQNF
ncbi:transmembrane protein 231 isoform X2 [Neocloeon triangulifer]|uniref:transmembrane protein 231 isoform X2 n=1 Tax=Neocloeon triangulifer TaxID=2078957 RepID=UPI00286F7566|nr:transmembrane protein 231 isoform X2 [Neocloeon triangulifer]